MKAFGANAPRTSQMLPGWPNGPKRSMRRRSRPPPMIGKGSLSSRMVPESTSRASGSRRKISKTRSRCVGNQQSSSSTMPKYGVSIACSPALSVALRLPPGQGITRTSTSASPVIFWSSETSRSPHSTRIAVTRPNVWSRRLWMARRTVASGRPPHRTTTETLGWTRRSGHVRAPFQRSK